jgi:TolC family type I secretion outer membrane protein
VEFRPRSKRRARAALVGALFAAAPGGVRAESLFDAINMAYSTNPGLKAQQATLAATNEGYQQARSNFGPQVSATGTVGYQTADVNLPPSLFTAAHNQHFQATTETADLSLSQPIYTFGRNHSRLAQASDTILAGRQNLRQVEIRLLLKVITAYADVLRDREIVDIVKSEIGDLGRISNDITAQGRLGGLSKTDVAQAQSRLLAAKTQLVQAEMNLSLSSSAYLAAVGQKPGELEPLPDLDGTPGTVDVALVTAEHKNPDLLAAIQNERAAYDQVAEAKSANGPTVSLQVDAGVQPYAAYIPNQLEKSVSAAVVFKQPIFTSGMNSSKVREAIDRDNSARLQVEQTRLDVDQQVSGAWDQLTAAQGVMAVVDSQLASEKAAYDGNVVEAKAGLRSTIDLLNSQLEFTDTRVLAIRDRHDAYLAKAVLMASVGTLEADRLIPGKSRPSPAVNFGGPKARLAPQWDDAIGRLLDQIGAPSGR